MYKYVTKRGQFTLKIQKHYNKGKTIFELGHYKQKFRQDKSLNRFISNHIKSKQISQFKDQDQQLADIQLWLNRIRLRCSDKNFDRVWDLVKKINNSSQANLITTKLEKFLIEIGLDDMILQTQSIQFQYINEQMFYHNSLNKEAELDYLKQIEKFNDFKAKVQPKFVPIFQKLSYKHNIINSEDWEIQQISRLNEFNNQQSHLKQQISQDNFNFNDFKQFQNKFMEQQVEEELVDEEGLNENNEQLEDDTLLSQQFQQDLIETTQKNLRFESDLIENDDKRFENKYSMLKYVNVNDVIVTQKGFSQNNVDSTNMIYCFGLPFYICQDNQYFQQLMDSIQKKNGPIKQIKLINQKDQYLSQQIRNHIDKQTIKDVNPFDDTNPYLFSDFLNHNFNKNLNKKQSQHDQQVQQLLQQDVYQISVSDMIRSKKIMKKINNVQPQNINSYMFIECSSYEQKQQILNNTLRVFGVFFNHWNIKFDDADYKRTLVIQNLPFNMKRTELVQQINSIFYQNDAANLAIEENQFQKDSEYYLNCGSILVRFNSFEQTNQAYELLKDNTIKNRQPIVNWYQGHLRKNGEELSESVDDFMQTINNKLFRNVQIWQKIQKNIQTHQNQNLDFYRDYFEENQFVQDNLNEDFIEEEVEEE